MTNQVNENGRAMGRDSAGGKRITQHANMRRKNESILLSLIRRYPGLSSAELSRRSGFAPQTVSVLLKGLEEAEVITRGEVQRGRRGQPAIPMLLNPDGAYAIGIEISWRHTELALIDLTGHMRAHLHFDHEHQRGPGLIDRLVENIETLLSGISAQQRQRILGIGIAMPTHIGDFIHLQGGEPEDSEILSSLDVAGELSRHTGWPVHLDNDGTCACRAEIVYGNGSEASDALHIYLGWLIGAGLYVGGRILQGRQAEGSGIGGSMVPGGNGEVQALHFVASIMALEDYLAAKGKTMPHTAPLDWPWDDIAGDFENWSKNAAAGIALAITNSCAVVRFPVAIIDGPFPPEMLEILINDVRESLAGLSLVTFELPMIEKGKMGALGAVIGAANMPLFRDIFSQELPTE